MHPNYLPRHQVFMVQYPNHMGINQTYLIPPQRPYPEQVPPLQIPFPPQPQPQSSPQPQLQPPPQPQTKEQTNVKVKTIKEKGLAHFIDGQIIFESSKPILEKKLKNKKKKLHHNQSISEPQLQHHQPQQQHQPQPHHHQQLQQQQQPVPQQQPPQQQQHQQQPEPQQQQPQQPQQQQQQRQKSVAEIRAEMVNWSATDVANFIKNIDTIKNYSSKFAEHDVDGLVLMHIIDGSEQASQEHLFKMFQQIGPAIKIELALRKYKLK